MLMVGSVTLTILLFILLWENGKLYQFMRGLSHGLAGNHILHRKNTLFYKSEDGAAVGEMLMSLIYTCEQAGVSPYDYLKALQDHAGQAKATPSAWMPWNFSVAPGNFFLPYTGFPEIHVATVVRP